MFAKKYRFSFKKGLPKNAVSTPLFTMRYGQSPVFRVQIAVVVSKKIDKSAAARNLIRRRFLHALHTVLKEEDSPFVYVFFLKKESALKKEKEFEKEIQNTLKRVTIV